MSDPNRTLLEAAAKLLAPLLEDLVFIGGCATGLLISDAAAEGIRPTTDVDVITEVASYGAYTSLSERLRRLGLREDTREGAPTCRWRYHDLIIDVMPTDETILGFSNRWYRPAIAAAQQVPVGGLQARVITPIYYLATKLEAFRGRGSDDYTGSHDLEDLVAVIDGRMEIVGDVRGGEGDVRTYVVTEIGRLLETPDFVDALPGFLLPDAASQQRLPILSARLKELSTLGQR